MTSPVAPGGRRRRGWSVFDAIKPPLPTNPDALMSAIDAATAAVEYARATAALSPPPTAPADARDVRAADEAYKAARAALAAGRPEAALRSLTVAIESCPPERASAVAKLRALVDIATCQLQQQQQGTSNIDYGYTNMPLELVPISYVLTAGPSPLSDMSNLI